jgi:hypothetical protein
VESVALSAPDLRQIEDLGLTTAQVLHQIALLRKADCFLTLNRPCTIGDGISRVPESAEPGLLRLHQEAAQEGRLLKFVPASGAASRMFKSLVKFHSPSERVIREHVVRSAQAGDADAQELLACMEGLRRFAFFDDLQALLARDHLHLDDLLADEHYGEVLLYLLTERGLNYANLPKGLLKFHRYAHETRTALEEHLVEAIGYVRDRQGICRLHFTVSPEHAALFRAHVAEVTARYETLYQVSFQVELSSQKPSTNTISLDLNDQPFRDANGALLFRPGGHGALIENLNDLRGDIVFLKNIDNVVPDRLKEETFRWKKLLVGYLVQVQQQVFHHLETLMRTPGAARPIEEALEFVQAVLGVPLPSDIARGPQESRWGFLVALLNRPVRVCGLVKNQGEPGGGPFWVEAKDGSLSLQLVEGAQVNLQAPEQRTIWNAATHFSPVDLVCGVRDFKGNPFDLTRYIDQEAVFVSQKSKDGRDLKALELPGLWNGAMADWLTFFVEVPLTTFNPVKTVADLLRDEHAWEGER